MERLIRAGQIFFVCLIFLFIYLPIVSLVAFSFNANRFPSLPWTGFSLHWYNEVFADPSIVDAFMLSILIGAALVLPPPVPEPQHLRRNEYGYVVDTPGDPELMTFEFRAEPTNEYIPLEIGVHRMLDDEPYEIVEMDGESVGEMSGRDLMERGIAFNDLQEEESRLVRVFY